MAISVVSDKNRRFLRMCRIGIRVVGWLVAAGGAAYTVMVCAGLARPASGAMQMMWLFAAAGMFLLGIIAIGLAQMIGLVLADYATPGWILRHCDKILYLYAATGLLAQLASVYLVKTQMQGDVWLACLPQTLFAAAKALVIVGLGLVLRRVIPMVEESKTLV